MKIIGTTSQIYKLREHIQRHGVGVSLSRRAALALNRDIARLQADNLQNALAAERLERERDDYRAKCQGLERQIDRNRGDLEKMDRLVKGAIENTETATATLAVMRPVCNVANQLADALEAGANGAMVSRLAECVRSAVALARLIPVKS